MAWVLAASVSVTKFLEGSMVRARGKMRILGRQMMLLSFGRQLPVGLHLLLLPYLAVEGAKEKREKICMPRA